MLSKTDLSKIRKVVRHEVKTEVKIQLKPINKKLDHIDKKLTVDFDHLDRRVADHDTRLNRIDGHLHFEPLPETPPSKYIQRLQAQLAR